MIGRRAAMIWLLLASLVFYGWWNPAYLPLILGSILGNYLFAHRLAQIPNTRGAKALLTLGVIANLGLLGYYKYANFFLKTVDSLTGINFTIAHIILPLGISFFTFTQIVYLVDASRGTTKQYSLLDYALFVSYFPHLIAGPIVHHWQLLPQFHTVAFRFQLSNFISGLTIFCVGIVEKMLIADSVARYASPLFHEAAGGYRPLLLEAWTAAIAYTLQLYFDFSGYSNMAIGLSKMFGIKLPINFNSPYKATSIVDFWRRWHITLSEFLRNYVYIPLGGNRAGKARRYFNLFVTMLVGGLWHGAGWTFIVWGGLHGIYLVINHFWGGLRGKGKPAGWTPSRLETLAGGALTFLCVVVGWVLFRAENFPTAQRILLGMTGFYGIRIPLTFAAHLGPLVGLLSSHGVTFGKSEFMKPQVLFILPAFLMCAWLLPNTQQWMASTDSFLGKIEKPAARPWQPRLVYAVVLGALFLCAVRLFFAAAPSEFLYFNF